MNNPFEQPAHKVNYAQYLRTQVRAMAINESKFVLHGNRSRAHFTGTLAKATQYKFRTKQDKTNNTGYWVKRIA